MKYSQITIACSESLRFFALLIMCCTILAHISATESLKNEDAHETRRELPASILQRRETKKNGTTNPQDIKKRLKIIEQRYVLLIQRKTGQQRGKMPAELISNGTEEHSEMISPKVVKNRRKRLQKREKGRNNTCKIKRFR